MKDKNRREELSKEDKLLDRGIELFSKNGYDATTTRTIAASCGINVATISFHFGSKEGFYIAVMKHAADLMEKDLRPFSTKVEQYMSGPVYEEKTLALIDEFFDVIINIVKNKKKSSLLYLLIREQTNPPDGDYPLTRTVYKQSEKLLINLLMSLRPNCDATALAILCRLIIGGLISQAEHPLFIRRLLDLADDAELGDKVWVEEKRFAISAVNYFLDHSKPV